MHACCSPRGCVPLITPSPSAPLPSPGPVYVRGNNEEFLGRAAKYAERRKWSHLLAAFKTAMAKVQPLLDEQEASSAADVATGEASAPDAAAEAEGAVAERGAEGGGADGEGDGKVPGSRREGGDEEMADAEDERALSHRTAGTSAPDGRQGGTTGRKGAAGGSRKASRGRGSSSGKAAAAAAAAATGQEGAAGSGEQQQAAAATAAPSRKRRKVGVVMSGALRAGWRRFASDLSAAERAAAAAEGGFAFAFVEGALVTALKEGWWLLLDEINLAPPEVLERIAGVLEASPSDAAGDATGDAAGDGCVTSSGLLLVERGDAAAVVRRPGFRLVAAMNPATDAGKRDLPLRLRSRFTELWVSEPSQRGDLCTLVAGYLEGAGPGAPVGEVVDFYRAAKAEAVSGGWGWGWGLGVWGCVGGRGCWG